MLLKEILLTSTQYNIQKTSNKLFVWGLGTSGQDTTVDYTFSLAQLSAGASHAIALTSDNRILTWGLNNTGQLGINDTINRSYPVQVGLKGWKRVAAGDSHSVAIRGDGSLFAWGLGTSGQLGYGIAGTRSSPVQVTTPSISWLTLAAGVNSTLGISNDLKLYAWGLNNAGQLGDTTTISKSSPVPIGTSSWSQVAVGASFAGGLLVGGELFTWGLNSSGQLGLGDTTNRNSPVQVGSSLWLKLSMGAGHTVAIRDDSLGYAWGLNNAYQLGDGTTTNRNSPVQIDTTLVTSWKSVSAGTSFTLGIGADEGTNNKLYAWGLASSYQLGTTVTINRSVPIQITTGSWSLIAAGGLFSVATNDNKFLYHWGSGAGGVGGDGRTLTRSSPTLVSFSQTISQSSPIQIGTDSWSTISAGTNFFAGIKSDGLLYSWGVNNVGQLGINSTLNRSSPVQIGTSSWTSVKAGSSASIAIRSDSTLWGWGNVLDYYGGVPPQRSWIDTVGHSNAKFALRSDNTIWGWGQNNNGILSTNDTINRSSPVQIGSAINWKKLGAPADFYSTFYAIATDDTAYAVGSGLNGEFGNNTVISRSNITQVMPDKTWSEIGGGMGITTDGKLWTWGYNINGTLGIGDTINRSSPTQILSGTSFTFIAGGYNHVFAISTTGTLYGIGRNTAGELGNNTTISRSSPVTLVAPFDTYSWIQVASGAADATSTAGHTLAIRDDFTLWSWGLNNVGQLGINTTINRSSPVTSIASPNSWLQIAAGNSRSVAINYSGFMLAWGLNSASQLGDGTSINRSSPVVTDSAAANVYRYINLSADWFGTAAIREDGTLYVWGTNNLGNLGDGTTVGKTLPTVQNAVTQLSSPVQIGSASNYTQISAGNSFYGAIDSTGALYTWGINTSGQLGQATPANNTRLIPSRLRDALSNDNTSSWTLVSAGNNHALAITVDGKLFAWGNNASSQLGDDTVVSKSIAVQIGLSYAGAAITSWRYASAGNAHSLAIDNNYNFYGWGLNNAGQIGVVTEAYSWKQVSTGSTNYAAAIRQDDTLWIWGFGTSGQLGLGDTINRSSPTQIAGSWSQISTTLSSVGITAGISDDSKLYMWGNNAFWSLGTGDSINRSSPTLIGNSSWSQVSVGWYHTLAIDAQGRLFGWGLGTALNSSTAPFSWTTVSENTSSVTAIRNDGLLFTWGLNSSGQLGNGTTINQSSPVQIGTSSWLTVSSGGDHMLGITSDYRLFAWGGNGGYQLGDTTNVNKSSPVLISGPSWTQVAAGNSYSMALKSDSTLWAWGLGLSGQLGTLTESKSWTDVSAGSSTSLAVRSDNTLWGWGLNTGYQIGDGSSVTKSSPVQVQGSLSWNKVSSGVNHTLGITNNGALYGWGTATTGATGNYFPLYSWTMITSTSGANLIAIRSDGSLWVLGTNTNGVLGLGDAVSRSNFVQVGSSSYIYVNAGYYNTFAITTDYKLFGWGDNTYGQLGDNTTVSKSSPIQIGVGSSWIAATAGSFHSLLLRSDYTLWSAGWNSNGQLGLGDIIDRSSITQVSSESYTVICAGQLHSAGIRSDSTLWTWGYNSAGQLGVSGNIYRSSPTQVTVPGTGPWLAVSAADTYTLGISGLGLGTPYSVYAWGGNSGGATGLGVSTGQNQTPVLAKAGAAGASFIQISTGRENNIYQNSMALASNGKLWMWGYGNSGEIGDNDNLSRSSPSLVAGSTSWSQIPNGTGGQVSLAIANDNTLYRWGSTIVGAFETDPVSTPSNPVQIGDNTIFNAFGYPAFTINSEPGQGSWTSVSAGNSFSLGIKENKLYAWGQNTSGQLAQGDTIARLSPTQVGLNDWSVIATSETNNFAGAIDSTNTLFLWGVNTNYQLGDGTTVSKSSPVAVFATGTSSYVQVSVGASHTLAVQNDGTLWAWGSNANSILGLGNTETRSIPTQIGTDSNWSLVSAGSDHSMAIKTNNTLWGWGSNVLGQIGLLTTTYSWTLVSQAGGDANSSFAIRNDGLLFAWGQNNVGQLGLNDTITRSSPVQIGNSSWTTVAHNLSHTIAVKVDGTLWAWGLNSDGRLGDNSIISKSSPVLVSGDRSNYVQVAAGQGMGYAITSDNTLYAWGRNNEGQLGQSNLVTVSNPVQVTGNWTKVAATNSSAAAIDNTGILYTWGGGSAGQLGTNTTINRSSPSQLAAGFNTFVWTDVAGGITHVTALRNNGALYSFGANNVGQLGDNSLISKSNPSIIQGTTSWAQIGSASNLGYAKDSNGRIWSWGQWQNGLGGNNTPTGIISSPIQISSSSFNSIIGSGQAAFAIRSDGILFGWGNQGTYGVVGDGTQVTKSSPTQIGNNNEINTLTPVQIAGSWNIVNSGTQFTLARDINNNLYAWGQDSSGQLGL
jgi:alpha-tubulin suppressor-like RCC1 family protein